MKSLRYNINKNSNTAGAFDHATGLHQHVFTSRLQNDNSIGNVTINDVILPPLRTSDEAL